MFPDLWLQSVQRSRLRKRITLFKHLQSRQFYHQNMLRKILYKRMHFVFSILPQTRRNQGSNAQRVLFAVSKRDLRNGITRFKMILGECSFSVKVPRRIPHKPMHFFFRLVSTAGQGSRKTSKNRVISHRTLPGRAMRMRFYVGVTAEYDSRETQNKIF